MGSNFNTLNTLGSFNTAESWYYSPSYDSPLIGATHYPFQTSYSYPAATQSTIHEAYFAPSALREAPEYDYLQDVKTEDLLQAKRASPPPKEKEYVPLPSFLH